MRTDELINALTEDAGQRRFPQGVAAAGFVALGMAATALLFLAAVGPRPDFGRALETLRFCFKFVVVAAIAVPAVVALVRLSRPVGSVGPWAWGFLVAPLLLVAATAVEIASIPNGGSWQARLLGTNALECLMLIPSLALPSLALLLMAVRYGATTRPRAAGILAGLGAASIAALFYAANCTDDSPLFVATWYPLAILIVAAMGGVIGPKVLRW
jgi:hypothetical protein